MSGEMPLDATGEEREDRAAARRGSRDERARAAAYLDLWERHVGLTAVDGVVPRPASLPAAPERSGNGA